MLKFFAPILIGGIAMIVIVSTNETIQHNREVAIDVVTTLWLQ